MKTILLLLITLLFISCNENEHILNSPTITSIENHNWTYDFYTGRKINGVAIYNRYKYRCQLSNTSTYLYTNTIYKVGDTLK
jgi:hypothetical protein